MHESLRFKTRCSLMLKLEALTLNSRLIESRITSIPISEHDESAYSRIYRELKPTVYREMGSRYGLTSPLFSYLDAR
jgi:hypothetical protein